MFKAAMQITLPVTIHRSPLGLVRIVLPALLAVMLLTGAAYYSKSLPDVAPITAQLAAFIILVIILVTLIRIAVYDLASMTLTEDGVKINDWTTLFWDRKAVTEWANIQDVTVSDIGPLQVLTSAGNLLIQTSSAIPNLEITYIGEAEVWASYIEDKAKNAPQLVHNV